LERSSLSLNAQSAFSPDIDRPPGPPPWSYGQHAAAALNGTSTRTGNPQRGFESMKKQQATPAFVSQRDAAPGDVGVLLTLPGRFRPRDPPRRAAHPMR
jgi:hypothetical protein